MRFLSKQDVVELSVALGSMPVEEFEIFSTGK